MVRGAGNEGTIQGHGCGQENVSCVYAYAKMRSYFVHFSEVIFSSECFLRSRFANKRTCMLWARHCTHRNPPAHPYLMAPSTTEWCVPLYLRVQYVCIILSDCSLPPTHSRVWVRRVPHVRRVINLLRTVLVTMVTSTLSYLCFMSAILGALLSYYRTSVRSEFIGQRASDDYITVYIVDLQSCATHSNGRTVVHRVATTTKHLRTGQESRLQKNQWKVQKSEQMPSLRGSVRCVDYGCAMHRSGLFSYVGNKKLFYAVQIIITIQQFIIIYEHFH